MKPREQSLRHPGRRIGLLVGLGFAVLLALFLISNHKSSSQSDAYLLTGRLVDELGRPVTAAEISLETGEGADPVYVTDSKEDGSWALHFDELPDPGAGVTIARAHFTEQSIRLGSDAVQHLGETGLHDLGVLALKRQVTAGFWASAAIFLAVLALIAFERLHSTTAALAGMSAIFAVTIYGSAFDSSWFIFDFERALTYVNWEVIFLVLGMMIVIAIIEGTGIFQWTAFQAYRLSGGRIWLLIVVLMMVTAVASALLDNFTTMLLMTPISLQIGLGLGINPLALIIPEVLASNVGGISTLIGTPTNILIGAHAGIGFTDFLINQTVGVVAALVVMAAYVLYHYRAVWRAKSGGISDRLYERLRENAELRDKEALAKSGIVFVLILVGFILGESIHLVPAVPAMIGATVLLVWLNPDVTEMIRAVDWTTLVFFIAIFIVIGAVQEVGLVSMLAAGAANLIGDSLVGALAFLVFGVGTLSIVVANIPLAASMLPIVDVLTGSIPAAHSKALYYALSMGAAMGGNGFVIGAEANLVTAGISEQAGTPISFAEFLKVGLPVTFLTLSVGFLWLVLRFVVFAG